MPHLAGRSTIMLQASLQPLTTTVAARSVAYREWSLLFGHPAAIHVSRTLCVKNCQALAHFLDSAALR